MRLSWQVSPGPRRSRAGRARWLGCPGLDLAPAVASRALADRRVDTTSIDGLVLGWTIPQPDIFYGAPTLAGRIGMPGESGPMISQACATSVAGGSAWTDTE
jgi:acetyl-CoA C-acetyltransferase